MYELPLNNKKLKDFINQCKHYSIEPLDLPSYQRGIKDNPIIKELLTELVEEATQDLLVLSNKEKKALVKSFPPGLVTFFPILDSDFSQINETDLKQIALLYIVVEVSRSERPFSIIVNENIDNSKIFLQFPELKTKLDKDNLLLLDDTFILHDYGIEYKNYIIQYHRFLRTRYISHSNSSFLGRWIDYYQKTKALNKFKIAIDHHSLLKPKKEYDKILEFDNWYGPPFDLERLDDPNSVGLTVIPRNKNCLLEKDYKLDRTEFFWSCQNEIKTFEIEEISDESHHQYCFNRYIHSERDITQKINRHIDGAVKVYLDSKYNNRKNTKLPNKDSYKKIKLWRIDGIIDNDNWMDLITFFYTGNEMIYQYFDPIGFEKTFELRVRDFEAWKKQEDNVNNDSSQQ